MANILGINLNDLPVEAVTRKISDFLSGQSQHYIVTPNPEIILAAHRDEELFYILNKADISLADGFGLKLAGLLSGQKIIRITGADFSLSLLKLAQERKIRTAVLNWRGGLSKKIDLEKSLSTKYPDLVFFVLDVSRFHPLSRETIAAINNFGPGLLFNTFGSPYQEKVIYHNLKKFPSVKLALGIGGAFDFLSGSVRRAPKILRTAGLEWLWRLIKKPQRWKRIYNATLVFTEKLLRARLNHFFYRPCVACLLYKKETNGEKKILIVEREDEPGHWQLPQGGRDGEDLKTAGRRELREELNTDKLIARGVFKNTHSYLFPPVSDQVPKSLSRRFKYDYKGQRQGLFIAEFIGSDSDIKVNFWDHLGWKWVYDHDFISNIHPTRRAGAKIFLEKFKSLSL